MRRFISILMMVLVVAAIGVISAVPAFADTNNAGDNNAVCQFQDGHTALVDADVCVSTGGVIVDVL
jgi:hypothetical protein